MSCLFPLTSNQTVQPKTTLSSTDFCKCNDNLPNEAQSPRKFLSNALIYAPFAKLTDQTTEAAEGHRQSTETLVVHNRRCARLLWSIYEPIMCLLGGKAGGYCTVTKRKKLKIERKKRILERTKERRKQALLQCINYRWGYFGTIQHRQRHKKGHLVAYFETKP